MHPPTPSHNLNQQNISLRNKARLHAALCMMPSLEGDRLSGNGYMGMGMGMGMGSGRRTTEELTRSGRDIHTLGHILLYEFRKGGWKRIKWGHAVQVAERWAGAFGLGGWEGDGDEEGG